MTVLNKQALREAAEKATKGQWAVEFDDEVYSTDGVNNEQIAMVFSENEARDAAFIAAANPATVLALLDELEAAEKRIAELEAREVLLPPKAPDNLASCLDGYEKWLIATTFRDTWNSCLAEVVRVNAAAGKGEAS